MTEAVVAFALDTLSELLGQIDLYNDLGKEVQRLQEEFNRMVCFLRDADSRQDQDARVRNWVSDVRNVAYDVEDVIDMFNIELDSLKNKSFFKRYASYHKEWRLRSKIANDLREIRVRLQEISASRERYGIRNIGDDQGMTTSNVALTKLRRSTPRGVERDIIGLEDDTANLVSQLVKTGERWRAISIIGMGGIGKTTLAKRVYNHPEVKSWFPSRIWIFLSQDFSSRVVLESIIRQLGSTIERLETLDYSELEDLLYDNLKRKRYLLVLDDIWSTDAWNSLAKAIPDISNGSRLLLTTRKRNVAIHVDPRTIPHELQFLSKENSWELFCRKAFTDCSRKSHPLLLDEIGKEIVDRCGGLPLAIIVIAGLLSRKQKPMDWERTLNSMVSHFAQDPTGVSAILALSYNDLPYHLKACFLYLAHFPEDHLIPAHKLFRLWVAEGLIQPQEGVMTKEDVAEGYLIELAERNMVQVARLSVNERIKDCRMHDLLRDLSISKAKEEKLFEIPGNESSNGLAKYRRTAIYSMSHLNSLQNFNPHLRTILFFQVVDQVRYKFLWSAIKNNRSFEVSESRFSLIIKSFRLLRVLDLEGVWCSISSTISCLINLKYLGVKGTNLSVLPSTIGSLSNLQTLDISNNLHLITVPDVIWKMEKLRHLYMSAQNHFIYLRIHTLKHLQTLAEIHVDCWKQNDSAKLTSLRKLAIRGNFTKDTGKLLDSIAALPQLRSLILNSIDAQFPLLGRLSACERLTKLHLKGRVSQLPTPQEFPPIISQITLEFTSLEQGSIKILEKLPKLLILRLWRRSYSKEKMRISANGFPELEVLELKGLESLEEIEIGSAAVSRLRTFRIVCCKNLKMLPEEMKSMTALQELEIEEMPKIFVDRIRGEDSNKVQHISSLIIV